MKRYQFTLCVICALCATFSLAAPTLLRWQTDVARPQPRDWDVGRGETVVLAPVMTESGAGVDLSASACSLYYQTNGMVDAWWIVPASTGLVAGEVRATWSPTNDCGASRYNYFVASASAAGTSYRAYGRLIMRHAPGVTPSILAAPTTLTDALASWAGGRFDPAGSAQGVSNALAAVLQVEAALRIAGDAASLAALASYAATNVVTRLSGTNSWQEVHNGTSYVYTVTTDTNRVRIVSTDAEFNGPAWGTTFTWSTGSGKYESGEWVIDIDQVTDWILTDGAITKKWIAATAAGAPFTFEPPVDGMDASGSCIIDYGTTTNREAQASAATVIIIADQVKANAAAIAALPLPPTNILNSFAILDSGSNRYWRVSATNLRFYVWGDL